MNVMFSGYKYGDRELRVNSNDGSVSDCSEDGTNELEARL